MNERMNELINIIHSDRLKFTNIYCIIRYIFIQLYYLINNYIFMIIYLYNDTTTTNTTVVYVLLHTVHTTNTAIGQTIGIAILCGTYWGFNYFFIFVASERYVVKATKLMI